MGPCNLYFSVFDRALATFISQSLINGTKWHCTMFIRKPGTYLQIKPSWYSRTLCFASLNSSIPVPVPMLMDQRRYIYCLFGENATVSIALVVLWKLKYYVIPRLNIICITAPEFKYLIRWLNPDLRYCCWICWVQDPLLSVCTYVKINVSFWSALIYIRHEFKQLHNQGWNPSNLEVFFITAISQLGFQLTHWGRVTHICVSKLTIIGSDNGLSPGRRQAIIWTNAGILLIRTLGTNFSEILGEMHSFSFSKMHLKMSSAK